MLDLGALARGVRGCEALLVAARGFWPVYFRGDGEWTFPRKAFRVAEDFDLPALDGGRRGVVCAPVTCEGESIVYSSSSSSSRSSVSISMSSSSTL